MKQKKFLLCVIAALLTFAVTSCNGDELPDIGKTLVGTSWKLVGFFDVEKNILTEPEVKDCEDCYTIKFTNAVGFRDGKKYWECWGHGIEIGFGCSYITDYASSTIDIYPIVFAIPIIEISDEENRYIGVFGVYDHHRPFELQDNRLKLYYNNKKNYLLFQPRRQ